jgi:hypothetical protein
MACVIHPARRRTSFAGITVLATTPPAWRCVPASPLTQGPNARPARLACKTTTTMASALSRAPRRPSSVATSVFARMRAELQSAPVTRATPVDPAPVARCTTKTTTATERALRRVA